jgi:hypothetical protein
MGRASFYFSNSKFCHSVTQWMEQIQQGSD